MFPEAVDEQLRGTVLISLEHRMEAARTAVVTRLKGTISASSITEYKTLQQAADLLKVALKSGGRCTFYGCIVMFDRGWTDWVEQRIHEELAFIQVRVMQLRLL